MFPTELERLEDNAVSAGVLRFSGEEFRRKTVRLSCVATLLWKVVTCCSRHHDHFSVWILDHQLERDRVRFDRRNSGVWSAMC